MSNQKNSQAQGAGMFRIPNIRAAVAVPNSLLKPRVNMKPLAAPSGVAAPLISNPPRVYKTAKNPKTVSIEVQKIDLPAVVAQPGPKGFVTTTGDFMSTKRADINPGKNNKENPVPQPPPSMNSGSQGGNRSGIKTKAGTGIQRKGPCKSCVATKITITNCEDKILRLWDFVESMDTEITNIIDAFPPARLFCRPKRNYEEDTFPVFNSLKSTKVGSIAAPTTEVSYSHKVNRNPDVLQPAQAEAVNHQPLLVCQICDKIFQTLQMYKDHQISHTRPHLPDPALVPFIECGECNARFLSNRLLREHMSAHVAVTVKRVKCYRCGKYYKNDHGLRIHLSKSVNCGFKY